MEALANERHILASQFGKLEDVHSGYISLVSTDISKGLDTKMSEYTEIYKGVKTVIDRYITSDKNDSSRYTSFRMEKMSLKKVDGFKRNYPQFQKDFKDIVISGNVRTSSCNDDVTGKLKVEL